MSSFSFLSSRTPSSNWRAVLAVVITAVLSISGLSYLIIQEEVRIAVAAVVILSLVAAALIDLRFAVLGCLSYLILLGDLRRVLLTVDEWSGTDPLLLIGPGFVILLFAYLLASRRISFDTPMSLCVLGLTAIMTLQIFNPAQGSLIVGIAGVLFLMVPLFWFWVGRAFGSARFLDALLYRLVCLMGVASVLFGLYQVLYGYLPYQMTWYHTAGYLGIGDPETGLAPISFFASGSEHGAFGIMTGVILLTMGLKKDRRFLLLLPIVIIATLLTGSRGPVAKLLVVAGGLWAIQGTSMTSWIPRGIVVLGVTGIGLFFGLSYITSSGVGNSVIQHKLNRQAQEFVQGEGAGGGRTTSGNHLGMMLHSYTVAVSEPLGRGLGATSRAAKLGATSHSAADSEHGISHGSSTETDLGDSFLALGFLGGVLYHVLVVFIIATGLRLWVQTRDHHVLAILGILGVTFLSWLGGGQYAVSPIVWVCIGALDRMYHSHLAKPEPSVSSPASLAHSEHS